MRDALSYFVRLGRLLRPYWPRSARGFALGLVVGLVGLVTPYLSKLLFDDVFPAKDFSLLHALVIGIAAFSVASGVMSAVRSYYNAVVSAQMSSAASLMYFNHVQHLPIRFFEERRVGEIMSRVGDMRAALGLVTRIFQTILINGVYLLLVPPFLLMLSWKLSIIALISTPLTAVVSAATSRVSRRMLKVSIEATAELSAIQVEALSQIRTLKVMAAEPSVFRDAAEQTKDALRAQLNGAAILGLIGMANTLIRVAGTGVYTWFAWTLILRGEITLGSFIAFSAYLGYLTGPVGQLAGLFSDFQQSSVALGRAFEYLDLIPEQNPELAYRPAVAIHTPVVGRLELEHVTFGYVPGKPVLTDVTLTLAPASVTAIVGSSGAGKSTIMRLLSRIESPDTGTIRVDGRPIRELSLSDYRRQVAVVWQEPTLLRGTIWQNLTYGLDSPDRELVCETVRLCRLDSLIDELPERYETMVGEWGATLSGGQRQRFALARALVCNTPIILLDEATSQVDVRTEQDILRELITRLRDKTVVVVTHRLTTASVADNICLLEHGRVTAVGSHQELCRVSQTYREMVLAAQRADERPTLRLMEIT